MDITAKNTPQITPIVDGMSVEEAKAKIAEFLTAALKGRKFSDEELSQATCEECHSSWRTFNVFTFQDGTQWVNGDKGLERIIGAYYLKQQLSNDIEVVDTKYMLNTASQGYITIKVKSATATPLKGIMTLESDDFISFSRYVGEKRPVTSLGLKLDVSGRDLSIDDVNIIRNTGFTDMNSAANLRYQEDKLIIIDTEYNSFDGGIKSDPFSEVTQQLLGDIEFTYTLEELGIFI